jgi:D-serine deaminase-like pyridoxal phosphate-dependent protein
MKPDKKDFRLTLDTPAAVVDMDVLKRNISGMAKICRKSGVALRPHIKTHKVPEIAEMQLKAGASGLTCAKIGEAEVMVRTTSTKDIFIANQIVGSQKIRRLLRLARNPKLKRLSVGVDSLEVARPISDAAAGQGLRVSVLIKIDVGQERTGVSPGAPLLDLASELKKMPGIRIEGIYTYEGQVYGAPDQEGIKKISFETGNIMARAAEELRQSGIPVRTVSAGSTPSAKYIATAAGITEIRPGSYVFNDYFQIRLGVAREEDCALSILATVISVPAPERAVVDAGTKVLFSDRFATLGVLGLVKGRPDLALVNANEEHGMLKVKPGGAGVKVGDKLEILPNHVCPAVNLFDELAAVRAGRVEAVWKVKARGKSR